MQLVLQLEVVEDAGLGFIHSKEVVAEAAIVAQRLAVLRRVAAVVATEAPRVSHVPNVVGIRAPRDFHAGEDVPVIDGDEAARGRIDFGALRVPDVGILATVKVVEAGGDFHARLGLRGVRRLN